MNRAIRLGQQRALAREQAPDHGANRARQPRKKTMPGSFSAIGPHAGSAGVSRGLMGVAIVVLGAGAHVRIAHGDALMFLGNLTWAFYNVYLRKLTPTDTSGIANTAGIMTTGRCLDCSRTVQRSNLSHADLRAGSALLAMSVGGGVLSYLFWNAGIAKLGPTRAPFS